MSRARLDVAVAGGGVVGAACALALARAGLEVALVEPRPAPRWLAERPDLRVYALAPDNAGLLDRLGVWPQVRAARAQPYRRMRVWDAAGGGELMFDAAAMARAELGWIVENDLLVDRLWAALAAAGVRLHCPARVEALEQDAAGARLRLDDGTRLDARIAIAADGAGSAVRRLAGLEVDAHDYHQRGVVAFIETGQPHEDTAWQRFLPTGPLALLPFADGRSSIVWTLPDAEAARVLTLDDDAFAVELTDAAAARLGHARPVSPRVAFPLRRQLVRQQAAGRVLVLGDAAHVVHPLAGQGVNLGLRDVAALLQEIESARAHRADWTAPHRLQRWARTRRSDNTVSAYAFEGINRLFSNANPAAVLARGPLLGLAGKLPPLQRALWRHAAGV
ncbi:UbiH/UbiF family hydroxylase [Pseudoxanthomonas suwonensis]|uniref:2-octaprenyl-3-methyl-6-methoxy-1,4-benzoquinol hydroxylase n=1 Tax=Pseudoxanthomonas suwonensis TaxID=314722 RepID=A0A0E3Z3X2_9GAMM|nr:UbiH/UbiF family hydroxylase [Pseudoxanthomonas suwonensis]AKC88369.1 2-octaprenyl-3-methyl-6-methoxy-1,4-benzoquinol hydroxylase [Pseudoxanthomonas suwonensis]